MSRQLKYKDVDVLDYAYQHYATTVRQKPYPTLKGTQMLLSELNKKDSGQEPPILEAFSISNI